MWFSNPIPSVSVSDVVQKLSTGNTVLIDVRTPEEFAGGHAKSAISIPLPTLGESVGNLKKYDEVYVICQSGGRSATATAALLKEHINATNVTGGTSAWRAQGLPME